MSVGAVAASAVIGGGGSAFSAAVLTDTPAFWGRLGDASGTTLVDSSGNGRNGTYSGSPTLGATGLVSGDTDTAVDFGTVATKYGQVANGSWMNGSFTVEAIVKVTSVTGLHAIAGRDSGTRGWTLYINAGMLYVDDPGGSGYAAGVTTLSTGVAYHVAVTYDGTNVKIYLNGILESTTARTLTVGSTNAFYIGANVGQSAFPLSGVGDEVIYYGSALSAARIAAHAAAAGYSGAAALGTTTWDFRGLSALPAGWSRRGVSSETFDAAGMSASYTSGQGHFYTLPAPVQSGTLETKMLSGGSNMIGPLMDHKGIGGALAGWYSGPANCLILGASSGETYDGNFANVGGTAGTYPVWFRVRLAAQVAYGSYSLDGSSWSSEVSLARAVLAGLNQIGVASIIGSATAKFEYVKWTP